MSTSILFQNTKELTALYLKFLGKTQESLDKDIDIIIEWGKTQPHLPEIPNRHVIANVLKANKCSIENSKLQIDMYYTVRNLLPEVFENSHPRNPEMQEIAEKCYLITLPKQTKQGDVVTIIKRVKPFTSKDLLRCIAYMFNVGEVRINEEVGVRDIIILDCEALNMDFFVYVTPTFLKMISVIYKRLLPSRIEKIILVNSPLIHAVLKLLKKFLSKKLLERLVVLDKYEELFDHVPKELLPKDYGGAELSLDELNEVWKAKLKEYYPRFDELSKMRVKEELRPTPLNNDDILGYYGNFKQLDVD